MRLRASSPGARAVWDRSSSGSRDAGRPAQVSGPSGLDTPEPFPCKGRGSDSAAPRPPNSRAGIWGQSTYLDIRPPLPPFCERIRPVLPQNLADIRRAPHPQPLGDPLHGNRRLLPYRPGPGRHPIFPEGRRTRNEQFRASWPCSRGIVRAQHWTNRRLVSAHCALRPTAADADRNSANEPIFTATFPHPWCSNE